jgi:hypothetical protein
VVGRAVVLGVAVVVAVAAARSAAGSPSGGIASGLPHGSVLAVVAAKQGLAYREGPLRLVRWRFGDTTVGLVADDVTVTWAASRSARATGRLRYLSHGRAYVVRVSGGRPQPSPLVPGDRLSQSFPADAAAFQGPDACIPAHALRARIAKIVAPGVHLVGPMHLSPPNYYATVARVDAEVITPSGAATVLTVRWYHAGGCGSEGLGGGVKIADLYVTHKAVLRYRGRSEISLVAAPPSGRRLAWFAYDDTLTIANAAGRVTEEWSNQPWLSDVAWVGEDRVAFATVEQSDVRTRPAQGGPSTTIGRVRAGVPELLGTSPRAGLVAFAQLDPPPKDIQVSSVDGRRQWRVPFPTAVRALLRAVWVSFG